MNRESELQIIEMLLMCNENTIEKMFRKDLPTFTDKIREFAVQAGGAVGLKIKRLFKSEM